MVTLGHASGLDLTSIDTVDDIELEGVEYTVADIDSGTTYGTGTNAGLGSTARNVIIAEEGSSWKVTTVASGNTAGTYANGDGITFFAD
jgi:hypothetical protein